MDRYMDWVDRSVQAGSECSAASVRMHSPSWACVACYCVMLIYIWICAVDLSVMRLARFAVGRLFVRSKRGGMEARVERE